MSSPKSALTPAAPDTVAIVGLSNIVSPDEGNCLIAHQHLSMVAIDETIGMQRIKPAELAARGQEIVPIAREQFD